MVVASPRNGFCKVVLCLVASGLASFGEAADEQAIQKSLQEGRMALSRQKSVGLAELALRGYALVKTGTPKTDPVIQDAVQKLMSSPIFENSPHPPHHIYEAGVRLMFLEAVDPVAHRDAIAGTAAYLIKWQRGCGAWYYPNQANEQAGDTSITQYALLGLWAAVRANVDVPMEVWEKAGRWHVEKQRPDGGFAYHPEEMGPSTMSMTTAGVGSTRLVRLLLFGAGPVAPLVENPTPQGRLLKFDFLERRPGHVDAVAPVAEANQVPRLRAEQLDQAITRGLKWMDDRYPLQNPNQQWFHYWLYGTERCGALLSRDTLGSHRWYDLGAEALVQTQLKGGSWPASGSSQLTSDAFSLLFLMKATSSLVPRQRREPLREGGLLVGGRGLPENLGDLEMRNGEVTLKRTQTPLDQLLSELEKAPTATLPALQNVVVEALPDVPREQLIGQIDLLRRLLQHPEPDVRQTAVWALGRSEDIRQAPTLIELLADPDLSVAREASLALSALARLPGGVGPGNDPEKGFQPNDTEDQQAEKLAAWKAAARQAWLNWYFQNRPYEERLDRLELLNRPARAGAQKP